MVRDSGSKEETLTAVDISPRDAAQLRECMAATAASLGGMRALVDKKAWDNVRQVRTMIFRDLNCSQNGGQIFPGCMARGSCSYPTSNSPPIPLPLSSSPPLPLLPLFPLSPSSPLSLSSQTR